MKRSLKYHSQAMTRISDEIAEMAQAYQDAKYEKWNGAFKVLFIILREAKSLIDAIERNI